MQNQIKITDWSQSILLFYFIYPFGISDMTSFTLAFHSCFLAVHFYSYFSSCVPLCWYFPFPSIFSHSFVSTITTKIFFLNLKSFLSVLSSTTFMHLCGCSAIISNKAFCWIMRCGRKVEWKKVGAHSTESMNQDTELV